MPIPTNHTGKTCINCVSRSPPILGDVRFDLAHQIGADVGRLGVDAAANTHEQREKRSAEPEAQQGFIRLFPVDQEDDRAAKQPEVSLAVSGYIKPTLSITPLSVNFGNFEPKADPVKRTVTIINNNLKNETFQVTKAESTIPGVKAEVVMTD
jgi:hypothetical protein